MQLKMSKPFNANFVKQMLLEENIFISSIFSKLPLPMSELADQDQQSVQNRRAASKVKVFKMPGKIPQRAQTFEQLHAKLDGLRNVKKLEYKQRQLKKNLKNKIKKMSKREERTMQKKLAKTEENAASASKDKKEDAEVPKIPRPKPVFNSEGNMVFSKFDFSEIGAKKKPPKSEKDPKKILQQLKQRKEKLKEMVELGEKEKAKEIQEKEAWKSVLVKAGGGKVKDDPDLLKRTIKRQDQKKKRSAKKWKSRLENVQKGLADRQDKRQDNITKRKKEKKLNKLKRSAKKGRVIPGF